MLLLLDESDFFLDADAKEGKFTHVAAFRELMEQTERAVKVVFAGLHQTARFERLANHPLAHFGNPVCVGPLTPQHAYDLLTDPLHALGYRFEDNNVAARVLALANNQPSLIQLFGAKLLTHLHRQGTPATPPQVVTAADIEAVWSDESLRESFRKRFDWTLNLDPRYKIIAYTVAYLHPCLRRRVRAQPDRVAQPVRAMVATGLRRRRRPNGRVPCPARRMRRAWRPVLRLSRGCVPAAYPEYSCVARLAR